MQNLTARGDGMNTNSWFFKFFSVLFIIGLYWFIAEVVGGWDTLAMLVGVFSVGLVVLGAIMAAIMGIIYWLTIARSKWYAKQLQEAGYQVYINREQVIDFSYLLLAAGVVTPFAIFLTQKALDIHLCVQANECAVIENWYPLVISIGTLLWLATVISIYGVISTWWQSFRPLKRYYKDMQLGHELDLLWSPNQKS